VRINAGGDDAASTILEKVEAAVRDGRTLATDPGVDGLTAGFTPAE
jgi:hypothetical protein